ncbi:MAG TPA: PAS domain S-box protein [Bacteroidales bacterium]|nr:PAS domain S-box protein [Bacteroidales bacterium]
MSRKRKSDDDVRAEIHDENDLQEKLYLFQNLVDNGLALIWVSGTDKLCTYFNKVWLDFTGRTLGQELGNGWAEGIHPDDFDSCFLIYVTAFDKREPFGMEYRLRHHSGEYRWIRDMGTPNFGPDGEFLGYIGHCFDISETKETERRLWENTVYLEKVFNEGSVAKILTCISDNRIKDINKAAVKLFGYSRDEVVEKSTDYFNYWADAEERNRVFEKTRPSDRIFDYEFQFRSKSGARGWARGHTEIIEILGEKYFFNEFVDITEQRIAQAKLIDSKRYFQQIFELNQVPMVFTTIKEGRYILVNNAYYELMGYSPEEIIGRTAGDINMYVFPDEREKIISLLRSEGKIRNYELHVRTRSGSVIVIEVSMNPLSYEGEDCILSTFTDITERTKTESELSDYRNNLEALVDKRADEVKRLLAEVTDLYENSPCGYHSLDDKGRFVRINKTELKWLGYELDELKGEPITKIQTPASQQKFKENFPTFLKSGKLENLEMEFVRKDESAFFVSVNATGRFDDQKRLVTSRSTVFDISERKQAEVELQRAKNAADQANRAKSEFLANMSHEIRTPMNAVLGYTELLGSTDISSTQKSYIESIKSSGKSLLTLINDILDLSKVEAGKLQLEFDYISSHSFFQEFESIFALKAKEKKLKFSLDLDEDLPEGLLVDEARLRQVIFNLVGNAIKFTEQGSVILKVRGIPVGKTGEPAGENKNYIDLEVEVSDTGIGISEESQNSVFDPFIQEQKFRAYGGTGLGLSISKRLVELMNGSLVLESVLGKGSTFKIYIPRIPFIQNNSQITEEITLEPSTIVFKESVILVADDVKHNRDFIRDCLSGTPLKLLEAENGEEAYRLICDQPPDLVITDIRMPVLSGFGLLDKIKANEKLKSIPVIAYSAEVLKENQEKIRKSLFSGLLIKPVKVKNLYLELMNWLPYSTTGQAENHLTEAVTDYNEAIDDLPGLLKILESDFYAEWEKFKVRQPVNEIKEFGNRLIETGTAHGSGLVADYGKRLIESVNTFDIDKLLSQIRIYPDLLSALRRQEENHQK